MNINELSIGNFVTIDNPGYWSELTGKTVKVESIGAPKSIVGMVSLVYRENIKVPMWTQFKDWVKPLPVTEELLLLLGFEKDSGFVESSPISPCFKAYALGNWKLEIDSDIENGFTLYHFGEAYLEMKVQENFPVHKLQNILSIFDEKKEA